MLHRRDAMLRVGQFGLGLTLPELLKRRSAAAPVSAPPPAKSCILLYLWGGPPQQDMWDMKPAAPEGIRSAFAPIATNVPGIEICDRMPLVARHADKLALIRSMTHPSTAHESSVYHTLTGIEKPGLVSPGNFRRRSDAPSVGSIVSHFHPVAGMPNSVTLPRPIGHDGITYAGTYAGFLGPRHDPLELLSAPNSNAAPIFPIELPTDLPSRRLSDRRGLLGLIEDHERWREQSADGRAMDASREQAFAMLTASAAKDAFNVEREDPRLRDRYGRNEYGESFLLARRLVEAGVSLVSVIWMYMMPNGRVSNVWDTHGGTAGLGGISGFAMLDADYCLPPFDRAFSALLEDLSLRGLLDETLVVVTGEFGRTPKINPAGGREHWGPCYTSVLAGGGVRGGNVHGTSDRLAAYPKDGPVAPEDLLATIYHALGIPLDRLIHDQEGRPHRITEGAPLVSLF